MDPSPDTNDQHRKRILTAAFLAWMFAGLENSLFILIHRQMMLELLGPGTAEKVVAEWFAWFQAAFLLVLQPVAGCLERWAIVLVEHERWD